MTDTFSTRRNHCLSKFSGRLKVLQPRCQLFADKQTGTLCVRLRWGVAPDRVWPRWVTLETDDVVDVELRDHVAEGCNIQLVGSVDLGQNAGEV